MNIKIINSNIEDNLSNQDCIYIKLDRDNPIIKENKIAYPILNAWLEKTSIDTIEELKIKLPKMPNLDYTFVNIIYAENICQIIILKQPIRVLNDKISINHYIDDVYYQLINNKWKKEKINVSYKADIDKDKINIIYSTYDIYDNQGNLFYKNNTIEDFYEFMFNKMGGE